MRPLDSPLSRESGDVPSDGDGGDAAEPANQVGDRNFFPALSDQSEDRFAPFCDRLDHLSCGGTVIFRRSDRNSSNDHPKY
jgi:hypothetical protein